MAQHVHRRRFSPVVLVVLSLLTLTSAALPASSRAVRLEAAVVTARGQKPTLILPGVAIYRDNFGVPHIIASTTYGVYYGSGYATAQDRLVQLEFYRFQAEGRTAEFYGSAGLGSDEYTREVGYSSAELAAMYAGLSSLDKTILRGYTDGVNAWLTQVRAHPKKLMPYEFIALHHAMQPWRVTDSVAVIVMMMRHFGLWGGQALRNMAFYQYLVQTYPLVQAQQIFNDFLYANDPSSPTSVPSAEDHFKNPVKVTPFAQLSKLPKHLNMAILQKASGQWQDSLNFDSAHGILVHLGSNGWAVAPSRSATGHAELFGGPMMGYSIPEIVDEQELVGPNGFNVEGMAFAGAPGIVIGHNAYYAWTMTPGLSDEWSWYAEQLNPANQYQYLYDGAWVNMTSRQETFQVAGGQPVTETFYRTVHGPVTAFDLTNHVAYSMKLAFWKTEVQTAQAVEGINSGTNIQQFQAAVSQVTPSLNFLYADQLGNIGYWSAGRAPIYPPNSDPRLPLPGNGQYEWRGFVPFARRPHVINPAQGWLANWNNKPSKNWPNMSEPNWQQANQVQHIFNLLAANPNMDPNGMNFVAQNTGNYDLRYPYYEPYLQQAVAQAGSLDPRTYQAMAELNGWNQMYLDTDNDGYYDSPGFTIFNQWLTDMTTNTFSATVSSRFMGYPTFRPFETETLRAIEGVNAPLPMQYQNYIAPGGVMTAVVASLIQAINELTAQYHSADMSTWLAPDQYIHFSPQGLGSAPNIQQAERGTYMQIVDLSTPYIWGENAIPPGQSGFISPGDKMSPHMTDQLQMYADWQYKPMLYYINPS